MRVDEILVKQDGKTWIGRCIFDEHGYVTRVNAIREIAGFDDLHSEHKECFVFDAVKSGKAIDFKFTATVEVKSHHNISSHYKISNNHSVQVKEQARITKFSAFVVAWNIKHSFVYPDAEKKDAEANRVLVQTSTVFSSDVHKSSDHHFNVSSIAVNERSVQIMSNSGTLITEARRFSPFNPNI